MERNNLIYLGGAIEASPDFGHGWRHRIDKRLRELGYHVYNPASDEQQILEPFGLKDAAEFGALKLKDFGYYREVMKGIIQYDLDRLAASSAIVALLDPIPSGGTAGEVTVMRWIMNKPVYAIVKPEDLPKISGWVSSCVTHFFKDEDTLIDYLMKYGLS